MNLEQISDVKGIKESIETVLRVIREEYEADVCALFLVIEDMYEDEKLQIFKERLGFIQEQCQENDQDVPEELRQYCSAGKDKKEDLKSFTNEIDILKFCLREAQKPTPSIPDPDPARVPGRLWKYSYKERPWKWVIFKNVRSSKQIPFEGLSAYAVRAGTHLFMPRSSDMNSYTSITHLNASRGITPEAKMGVFLTLRDPAKEDVIGLVKVENYSEIPDKQHCFTKESEESEEAQKYIALLQKLIKRYKAFYAHHSYATLYGGMELLELLSKITPEDGLDKEIYDLTHHLFCVLYRKEYVGHDEIMTRVTDYADDLADAFGVSPEEGFFKKLLERRRKHEDLMLYETQGYRDHFMHQFHVFVTGYILLHEIGLKRLFTWIGNSLEFRRSAGPDSLITEESVLRIWFLTAFMHDAAYVFEKFGVGMATFLEKEWGHRFTVAPGGAQLLEEAKPFGAYLGEMLDFFSCKHGTNQEEILQYYLDSIIGMSDHGVLSSLWMIQQFNKGRTRLRIEECYLAALAISFHNPTIFKHLTEENKSGIPLECLPIPFLLAFCDTVQIWGRTRGLKEGTHVELKDINTRNIGTAGKEITCKLFYRTDQPSDAPSMEMIKEELVQSRDEFFRSAEYRFRIEFYRGDQWSSTLQPYHVVDFRQLGS